MKNKILFIANFIWTSFIAFSFPVCLGIIYMNITGHSKGYGYDLGPDKDISIMMGIFELIIWLILAMPSNIYVFKKVMEKGKLYAIIPVVIYVLLFGFCIFLTGGWNEFMRFFHA